MTSRANTGVKQIDESRRIGASTWTPCAFTGVGCCIDPTCPHRGWFGHGIDKLMDAWLRAGGIDPTRIRRYRTAAEESEG